MTSSGPVISGTGKESLSSYVPFDATTKACCVGGSWPTRIFGEGRISLASITEANLSDVMTVVEMLTMLFFLLD